MSSDSISSSARNGSSCPDCFVTVLAGSSLVVYTIVELVKWVFNHLKEFSYYSSICLKDYMQASSGESKKYVIFIAEILSVSGASIRNDAKVIFRNFENSFFGGFSALNSALYALPESSYSAIEPWSELMGREAIEIQKEGLGGIEGILKGVMDAPGILNEASTLSHELSKGLLENFSKMALTSKEVCLKNGTGIREVSYESSQVCWTLLQDEVEICIAYLKSGWESVVKIAFGALEVMEDANMTKSKALKAIIANLLQYLATGTHQLNLMLDEIGPILESILFMSKEGIISILICLIEYLVSGVKEIERYVIGGFEAFEEVTIDFRMIIKKVILNLIAYSKAISQEAIKIVEVLQGTIHEIYKSSKDVARGIRGNLKEIIQAGRAYLIKSSQGSLEGLLEWDLVLREFVACSISSIFEYLLSGSPQAEAFLISATEGVVDMKAAPRTLIVDIVRNTYSMAISSLKEADKLCIEAIDNLAHASYFLFEIMYAICENLWNYVQSGGTQMLLWISLLREDLPDTFRILIQDPLESFFAPKYAKFKLKLQELSGRLSTFRERGHQRMQNLKRNADEKIEEIRENVRIRLAEIREQIRRRF